MADPVTLAGLGMAAGAGIASIVGNNQAAPAGAPAAPAAPAAAPELPKALNPISPKPGAAPKSAVPKSLMSAPTPPAGKGLMGQSAGGKSLLGG